MNPEYENINTNDILDEVNQGVIKMFDGFFEKLNKPKEEEEIDELFI